MAYQATSLIKGGSTLFPSCRRRGHQPNSIGSACFRSAYPPNDARHRGRYDLRSPRQSSSLTDAGVKQALRRSHSFSIGARHTGRRWSISPIRHFGDCRAPLAPTSIRRTPARSPPSSPATTDRATAISHVEVGRRRHTLMSRSSNSGARAWCAPTRPMSRRRRSAL